jgi:hypothetical protein
MAEQHPDTSHELESSVQDSARAFSYPPTPDIASAVRNRLTRNHPSHYRRLAWVAAVALLVMAALLAVPEARAVVQEILRVGGIQIFLVEPTATITPTPVPSRTPRPTLAPEPTPVTSVLDLPGETTLDEVRNQVSFDVLLPTYPEDLGTPDRIFLQDLGGDVVTLVWLEPENPGQSRLALQILDERVVGSKLEPNDFEMVSVDNRTAYWLTGEHVLAFYESSASDFIRIINDNVLIWEVDRITYRLETDAMLEEAVRIAESLQ